MIEYYNTAISKCKWRQTGVFMGERYAICHNPDAIRQMKNGGDCSFNGNMKADSCNYFERLPVNQKGEK